MNLLFKRRSVKQFTGDAVSDADVDQIIRAGMQAPSAVNRQPWEFVVVRDRTMLQTLSERHPTGKMCAKASAVVLVCGRTDIAGSFMVDCAAAVQNMLLQATELGVGALWCGVYPHEGMIALMRELFAVPDHVMPFALVPMGGPAVHPEPVDRYCAEKVFREMYGKN